MVDKVLVRHRLSGTMWFGVIVVLSIVFGDGCVLVSTFCKYTLSNGDLFDLSCARVRRVRREVSPQSC